MTYRLEGNVIFMGIVLLKILVYWCFVGTGIGATLRIINAKAPYLVREIIAFN